MKQIIQVIKSCNGCPYLWRGYDIFCNHPDFSGSYIKNLNIIHEDCPLDDYKEEKKDE